METATFTRNDDTTGTIGEVLFYADTLNSTYNGDGETVVTPKQLEGLPNLKGYGILPDLHVAASQNEGLYDLMREISDMGMADLGKLHSKVLDLVYKWAGVEDVPSTGNFSMQKLVVLEKFMGRNYKQGSRNQPTGTAAVEAMNGAWDSFITAVYNRIVAQTVFADIGIYTYFSLENDAIYFIQDAEEILSSVGNAIIDINESVISKGEKVYAAHAITALVYETYKGYDGFDAAFDEMLEYAGMLDYKGILSSQTPFIVGSEANNSMNASNTGSILEGREGNDTLYGRAGDDILDGGAGDDKLYGETGNDILDGGTGNDTLVGGLGDDTYVFGFGYGSDIIDESGSSNGGNDVIEFLPDVRASDITVTRNKTDVIITLTDGSTLTVKGDYNLTKTWMIETLRFTNGIDEDIDFKDLIGNTAIHGGSGNENIQGADGYVNVIYGHEGNDTLVGRELDDVIDGGAGNDTLYGRAGDDILDGGAGDDKLYGETGNDILDGGTGNDTLVGGLGDDTYVFGFGYGSDIIDESYTSGTNKGGGNDTLSLFDMNYDQIWLNRSGNNLVVSALGSNDTMTIKNWYARDSAKVETFETADGKYLDHTDVDLLVQAMAGFNPPSGNITDDPTLGSLQNTLNQVWQART